jgi:hypothetical protein
VVEKKLLFSVSNVRDAEVVVVGGAAVVVVLVVIDDSVVVGFATFRFRSRLAV